MQEAEARLKPGTIKHCALTVLRDAGARGMPIDDIMAAVATAGLRQWDANSKRVVQFVRPPFVPLPSCIPQKAFGIPVEHRYPSKHASRLAQSVGCVHNRCA